MGRLGVVVAGGVRGSSLAEGVGEGGREVLLVCVDGSVVGPWGVGCEERVVGSVHVCAGAMGAVGCWGWWWVVGGMGVWAGLPVVWIAAGWGGRVWVGKGVSGA